MLTGTITPGTDKAQIFSGVRKLGTPTGMAAELSAAADTNNGSFSLIVPRGVTAGDYGFFSRGSVLSSAVTPNNYPVPITNVLTGIGDIATDTAVLRVNGVQAASSTSDQGTGNYLAYPLYIGRRGGTTLPLNGRIYSLIVRFGANLSASTISQTEVWVGGKTGVTI